MGAVHPIPKATPEALALTFARQASSLRAVTTTGWTRKGTAAAIAAATAAVDDCSHKRRQTGDFNRYGIEKREFTIKRYQYDRILVGSVVHLIVLALDLIEYANPNIGSPCYQPIRPPWP